MLFYYCWFNAELVLHSRADRGQLFSGAKWRGLLSVRLLPALPLTNMHVNFHRFWIGLQWRGSTESLGWLRSAFQTGSGTSNLCGLNWHNRTWVGGKQYECALGNHEEDCWSRKVCPPPRLYHFSLFFFIRRVKSYRWICLWMSLSLFWAHCLHIFFFLTVFNFDDGLEASRFDFLTTVCSLQNRRINRSTPFFFVFALLVLTWNRTTWNVNSVDCESAQSAEVHLP